MFGGSSRRLLVAFFSLTVAWCAVIGPYIFFSFMGAFGLTYDGRETSSSYIFFTLTSAFAMLSLYFLSLYRRPAVRSPELFPVWVLTAFVFYLLFFVVTAEDAKPGIMLFFNWTVLGLPGAMAYFFLRRSGYLGHFAKSSIIVAAALIIMLLMSSVGELIQGQRSVEVGGATYQNFSYIAATSFALIVLKISSYSVISRGTAGDVLGALTAVAAVVFALAAVALVVLGGGRGAMLTIILFAVLFIYREVKGGRPVTLLAKFAMFFVFGVTVQSFILRSPNDWTTLFEFGFNRAFSYLSDGNVDLVDGSGGRASIYQQAFDLMSDSPLVGYGVFGVHGVLVHPHNIFLETALQLGIPIAVTLIGGFSLMLLFAIRSTDSDIRWCCWFFSVSMIMLLFSGSYLETASFWFGIAALIDWTAHRFGGGMRNSTLKLSFNR